MLQHLLGIFTVFLILQVFTFLKEFTVNVYNFDLLLHTIANYCSLPSFSFGQVLGKLQGKVVTHFEKLGWWNISMVECVTLFLTIWSNIGFHNVNWPSYINIITNWLYTSVFWKHLNTNKLSYSFNLGHFTVAFVPQNLMLDQIVKKGLHIPPSKYSTSQVFQNV